MLFQSTHEDRLGAEALAEPGERIVKSPLQRTLLAHIMSRWAKHKGALAHISLQRPVEVLALQCAQRFSAKPADPDSSVFAELFPRFALARCASILWVIMSSLASSTQDLFAVTIISWM